MRDIVVTWPQSRPLDSYVGELARAKKNGLVINYRVARLPSRLPERCYVVHSGFVRGWSRVLDLCRRDEMQVARAENDSGFWPGGLYVVRSPDWHALKAEVPMKGFQGWRWFNRRGVS